jgi:hypothetical protein
VLFLDVVLTVPLHNHHYLFSDLPLGATVLHRATQASAVPLSWPGRGCGQLEWLLRLWLVTTGTRRAQRSIVMAM